MHVPLKYAKLCPSCENKDFCKTDLLSSGKHIIIFSSIGYRQISSVQLTKAAGTGNGILEKPASAGAEGVRRDLRLSLRQKDRIMDDRARGSA